MRYGVWDVVVLSWVGLGWLCLIWVGLDWVCWAVEYRFIILSFFNSTHSDKYILPYHPSHSMLFFFFVSPVSCEKDLTERGFKWNNDEGRVQHDAHELIRLLIDRLEMDMKFSKINSGLVSALYEGQLVNQVRW